MTSKKISFNENYQQLKSISDKLKNENDVDIDSLEEMIKSAADSYENCKIKLDSIKQLIEEYSPDTSGHGNGREQTA